MISWLLEADGNALLYIQEAVRNPVLTAFLRPVTHLGDAGIAWILLTLVLLFFRGTRKVGICSVCALLCSLVLNNFLLKNIVARVRPYDAVEGLTILIGKQLDPSFPSGHSAASFASALAIVLALRRWDLWKGRVKAAGICAVILAALIALSRLYVGVHYPTDVLFGIFSGLLCGYAGFRIGISVAAALGKKYPGWFADQNAQKP